MREPWLLAEAARQRLKTKKVSGTDIILKSKHLYADVQISKQVCQGPLIVGLNMHHNVLTKQVWRDHIFKWQYKNIIIQRLNMNKMSKHLHFQLFII